MGYTHYFKAGTDSAAWEAAFPQLALDAKKIADQAVSDGIELAGPSGDGAREIGEGRISLNGLAPEHYETFELTHGLRDFDFCKTNHHRYDAVVCAILLRAKALCPTGIIVSSDGIWEDWLPGRGLYNLCFDDGQPEASWLAA